MIKGMLAQINAHRYWCTYVSDLLAAVGLIGIFQAYEHAAVDNFKTVQSEYQLFQTLSGQASKQGKTVERYQNLIEQWPLDRPPLDGEFIQKLTQCLRQLCEQDQIYLLDFSVSPKDVRITQARFSLVKRTFTIRCEGYTDTAFFRLFEKLQRAFPAFVILKSYRLKRLHPITKEVLFKVAEGARLPLIRGTFTLETYRRMPV